MKTHRKLQKILATLMISILMTEFTGCYSSRIATSSDIKSTEIYYVHGQKLNCHISEAVVLNGTLSGSYFPVIKYNSKLDRNNIYVSSDSVVKIENNILSMPVGNITKIEQRVPDPEKTKKLKIALIVGCSALTVLGVISTILMINSANNAVKSASSASNGCTNTQTINENTIATTFCEP